MEKILLLTDSASDGLTAEVAEKPGLESGYSICR